MLALVVLVQIMLASTKTTQLYPVSTWDQGPRDQYFLWILLERDVKHESGLLFLVDALDLDS